MDEHKRVKLITIIASLILIVFVIAIVVITIANSRKTATLETKIVPLSATITIQEKKYRPNQNYKFEPGEMTATISAEGYQSKEVPLNLKDGETTTLAVALYAADGTYSTYCQSITYDKECQLFEEIMQIQSTQAAAEYAAQYPVSTMLPLNVVEVDPTTYDWTEYRIDCGYFEECKNPDFCIKITDTTGGNREKALQKIRDGGFNPNDYEIIYEYVPVIPLN